MSSAQSDGYLATPPSGNGKPVLVLHPWWGLNDTIKAFCDRLAGEGFLVFAPDLYHGKITNKISEAEAFVTELEKDVSKPKADVAQGLAYLKEHARPDNSEIAVIGFSLGAYYALDLSAAENVRSVVLFYGTGPADFSKSKAEYLGHFAEIDPYEPSENVKWLEDELKNAGRPVTFYTYPDTGHWFFESDRDVYNQEAANLAWERTLAFLNRAS